MAKLNGQSTLVTGAGRGIGRAIALAFAREGARVAVTARTRQELDELVTDIDLQGESGRALAIVADLADPRAAAEVVAQAIQAFGPVEVLVNNAGVGGSGNPKPLVDFDDAFWDLTRP